VRRNSGHMRSGDVYALNDPYNGGTHLPDITVVTPVFIDSDSRPAFYVGSRGHHADIGGISPGSMPPFSRTLTEEGILLDNVRIVSGGNFEDAALRTLLGSGAYPARNISQNIADLHAQIAANEMGGTALRQMVSQHGLQKVNAYMQFVQDHAAACVERALLQLNDGECITALDCGAQIKVKVRIHKGVSGINAPNGKPHAEIDFFGTSPELTSNFNAPAAVVHAAVLYVFRLLIDADIPLNAGCMRPLTIIIPEGSMLNPAPPAATVAGNVETSQRITDALLSALGIMAASGGSMNNFTFGNNQYQYYETVSGGTGAGAQFDGTDTVQAHMTNSRLTDPEVLELRYPVLVESHAIRRGSGGLGFKHGGNGATRRIRFLEQMTAAILSSSRNVPPCGLAGGMQGATGSSHVERRNGEVVTLAHADEVEVEAGDVFVLQTPGGGGYGVATS
jgi:5-oxoprolinase (ATP-hydrolysing)